MTTSASQWLSGKELACNAGDTGVTGSVPGSGSSPGEENGNPLQYSCLENSMDRGDWWVTVHRVAELDTTEHARTHRFFLYPKALLGHHSAVVNMSVFAKCHWGSYTTGRCYVLMPKSNINPLRVTGVITLPFLGEQDRRWVLNCFRIAVFFNLETNIKILNFNMLVNQNTVF